MMTAEWLLLFVPFWLFFFMLVQFALAYVARITVTYAAFAAARAAVVVLPASGSEEEARAKVHLAAVYPLMTFSPGDDESGSDPGDVLGRKISYAKRATAVRIHPTHPGWNEQVSVEVAYLFRCGWLLSGPFMCKRFEEVAGSYGFVGNFPDRYLVLHDTHTLTNQGRP